MDKNKNVWLLPTDKPSRLWINNLLQGKLELSKEVLVGSNTAQSIYITSDEKIEGKDYVLSDTSIGALYLDGEINTASMLAEGQWKKIILTDNKDLIKDGVQSINDEFLQWFIMNPSCEYVETKLVRDSEDHPELVGNPKEEWSYYDIIIPQEEPKQECPHPERAKDFYREGCFKCWQCGKVVVDNINKPKQETLEEFAEKLARAFDNDNYKALMELVIEGAKFQAERMYSEEEVRKISLEFFYHWWNTKGSNTEQGFDKWVSQFKKQNNEQ
jgi:hypothetical protein